MKMEILYPGIRKVEEVYGLGNCSGSIRYYRQRGAELWWPCSEIGASYQGIRIVEEVLGGCNCSV
jgi:hypothetical protein